MTPEQSVRPGVDLTHQVVCCRGQAELREQAHVVAGVPKEPVGAGPVLTAGVRLCEPFGVSIWSEFLTNRGRPISKWTHYFPAYERHLAPFVNQPVTLLEIGCGQGGSLELWRRHLGPVRPNRRHRRDRASLHMTIAQTINQRLGRKGRRAWRLQPFGSSSQGLLAGSRRPRVDDRA
jgi:hypothetical protein